MTKRWRSSTRRHPHAWGACSTSPSAMPLSRFSGDDGACHPDAPGALPRRELSHPPRLAADAGPRFRRPGTPADADRPPSRRTAGTSTVCPSIPSRGATRGSSSMYGPFRHRRDERPRARPEAARLLRQRAAHDRVSAQIIRQAACSTRRSSSPSCLPPWASA
jgi:hypothetical protein